MKTIPVLLLLALSALALAYREPAVSMDPAAETGGTPPTTAPAPKTTAAPAPKTTAAPAPKTTAAPAPKTTAAPAPKTTAAPAPKTTAAPAPKTTAAPAPNTTAAPAPKTTAAPAPKTTAKPAPKPTTTPAPPPTTKPVPPTPTKPPMKTNGTVGNYTLDVKGQLCLMVQMELRVRLVAKEAKTTFLLLPNQTSTSGECNKTHATLALHSPKLNLTMWFFKNESLNVTFVSRLAFNLTFNFSKKGLEETTYSVDNKSIHFFNSKVGHSYSCRKESLETNKGLFLDLSSERIQAFNFTKSNEFGINDPCPNDQGNYRVAIAVGITLLVLVVVVAVAYLLSRRRRTEGYQSL